MRLASAKAVVDDVRDLKDLIRMLTRFDGLEQKPTTRLFDVLVALKNVRTFVDTRFFRAGFAQSFSHSATLRLELARALQSVHRVEQQIRDKDTEQEILQGLIGSVYDCKMSAISYGTMLAETDEYAAAVGRGELPSRIASLFEAAIEEGLDNGGGKITLESSMGIHSSASKSNGRPESEELLFVSKSQDIHVAMASVGDLDDDLMLSPLGMMALYGNAEAVSIYLSAMGDVPIDQLAEALAYCSSTTEVLGSKPPSDAALRIAAALISHIANADDAYLLLRTALDLGRADFVKQICKHVDTRGIGLWQAHGNRLAYMLRMAATSWPQLEALAKSVTDRDLLVQAMLEPAEADESALHILARQGAHKRLNIGWLTQAPGFIAGWCDSRNEEERTPLEEALAHGDAILIKELHQSGVRLNFEDPAQASALGDLILDGLVSGKRTLLKTLTMSPQGQTFFKAQIGELAYKALQREDIETAKLLLREYAPSVRSPSASTNILHLAAETDLTELIDDLYKIPAEQRAKMAVAQDSSGRTAAQLCTSQGMRDLCEDSLQANTAASPVALKPHPQTSGVGAAAPWDLVKRTPAERARAKLRSERWSSRLSCCATWQSKELVINAFLGQASQATYQSRDLKAAYGAEAWLLVQRLHLLSDRSEAVGHHYASHQPALSDERLLRRLAKNTRSGSSRFGQDDAIAILSLRRRALEVAAQQMGTGADMYTLYLHHIGLDGSGFTMAQSNSGVVRFSHSQYLKFVLRRDERKNVAVVAMYPVPNKEGELGLGRGLVGCPTSKF